MIRLAMVGCGKMSAAYLKQMEPLADRLGFTALVDIDLERARAAAQASPVAARATCATDYRDILDQIDAAIIALPHDLHHEVSIGLMEAGKHVLIEKPLANTERQCLDIIDTAEHTGVVAMHGYVMRHNPLVRQYSQLLRDQAHGEPFHVSIWTEQYTDASRGAWIGQVRGVGGGQLFSHGCHYIDLLLHWLGEPIEGTHVGTNLGTPWMEMEGTSNVAMKFASGATAYHFGTWGARGSRLGYSFQAHCTGGMLEMDRRAGEIVHWLDPSHGDLGGMTQKELEATKDKPRSRVLARAEAAHKHTAAEVEHFIDCIEQSRTPETDLPTGLQSLRAIWRLYDAEQRGIVADLRGLGHAQFSPEPDPVLAERKRFGYTCDYEALFA
ncbi:MAG: Gfo/Idh/MocA family oxidoreductase [Phycisphaeraceae bacterium]